MNSNAGQETSVAAANLRLLGRQTGGYLDEQRSNVALHRPGSGYL